MNTNWTPIILAVLTLLTAIVTYIVKPLVTKKIEESKANMDKESREKLDYWMGLFIKAAETLYEGGGLGEKKADWVIEQLKKMGIEFDENTVRLAITGMCRTLTATGEINSAE